MAPAAKNANEQLGDEFWNGVFGSLDVEEDDPNQQQPQKDSKTAPPTSEFANKDTDELGIDHEIQQTKRRPVVKLTPERLLSQNGIPKLNRIAKTKLKLKGKGHEFSDATRILTMYQIWLHELYPKANFLDGLYLIEKLGHTRQIGEARKTWIEEATQKAREKTFGRAEVTIREKEDTIWATHKAEISKDQSNGIFVGREGTPPPTTRDPIEARDDDIWDNDLYSITPQKLAATTVSKVTESDEVPEEDELDMLLNAQENPTSLFGDGTSKPKAMLPARRNDEMEDEMDFWDV